MGTDHGSGRQVRAQPRAAELLHADHGATTQAGGRRLGRAAPRGAMLGPWALEWLITLAALPATVVLAGLADGGWRMSWSTAALAACTWLPLLLLRSHPRWALAGAIAAQTLWSAEIPLWGPVQFTAVPVAVLVATFGVTARSPLRAGLRVAVVAGASQLLTGVLLRPGHLDTTAFAVNLTALSAGIGLLVRDRSERLRSLEVRAVQAEQDRSAEAKRQVNAERMRIARDLHDVLAHDIALINAQSGVAAYLMRTDPVAAEKALGDIAKHTRQALEELRATVGLLRQSEDTEDTEGTEDRHASASSGSDHSGPHSRGREVARRHPTPGLADLEGLMARYRDSGSKVEVRQSGQRGRLGVQTDIAAYRIVQEAMTNAAKHAPAAVIEVDLDWSTCVLRVSVSNDRTADSLSGHRSPGTGHGLIGMRERATSAGGSLEVSQDHHTFRVTAYLPMATDH